MIRLIEEMSLNAWPALQTMLVDGWTLRFSGGFTRRSNSVQPLYGGETAAGAKIELCEAIYRSRALPCIFKISPLVHPARLDALLEQGGYSREGETSVQVVELDRVRSLFPERAVEEPGEALLAENLSEAFLSESALIRGLSPEQTQFLAAILQNIVTRTCYVLLRHNGRPVGSALGVLQQHCMGIYEVAVLPEFRRRGFGRRLIYLLHDWARGYGITHAYLSAEVSNAAALRLYEELGYRELYRYWYRTRA